MGIGTIIYYLLWPIVLIALLTFWLFKGTTIVMEASVEFIKGLHEDIKNI